MLKIEDIDFTERIVTVNRVTKVVKGGRRFSFSVVVVIGNRKGIVGYGLGKANEINDAVNKAREDAKKNLIKIPIINSTLPHETIGKFGGGFVLIKPATVGTGVIAGGTMRYVLETAGIHNCLAKSKGSSNPHNVVKATFHALEKMRDPFFIAKQRGISLEKVFNG